MPSNDAPFPVIIELSPYFIDDVAQLEAECFSQPWSARLIEDELSNPMAQYFVSMCDAKLCGYCGYMFPGPEGEITRLATHAKYRHRGIARALLKHLMADAMKRGLTALDLEVREGNIIARKLYKSLGFDVVGHRTRYYQNPDEDAVLLSATLQISD